jgi:hypothetical protein
MGWDGMAEMDDYRYFLWTGCMYLELTLCRFWFWCRWDLVLVPVPVPGFLVPAAGWGWWWEAERRFGSGKDFFVGWGKVDGMVRGLEGFDGLMMMTDDVEAADSGCR